MGKELNKVEQDKAKVTSWYREQAINETEKGVFALLKEMEEKENK